MTKKSTVGIGFDVVRAWQETKKAIRAMTPEEQKQMLVKSGILTAKGNVAKPYYSVIEVSWCPFLQENAS